MSTRAVEIRFGGLLNSTTKKRTQSSMKKGVDVGEVRRNYDQNDRSRAIL